MIEISGVAVFTALMAGAVSFLSPCVLPLVPGYVSYVAGRSVEADPRSGAAANLPAIGLSLLFVLGFSSVFITLGASATALGQLFLRYRYEANLIGGGIIVVFGLFMLGGLKLSWLQRDFRLHSNLPGGRPPGAFLMGVAFGFGWTPCIGPVLGTILTLSAVTATIAEGIVLLAFYSIGLGIPFLLAATFTGAFLARVKSGPWLRRLQQVSGAVMILMGVAMVTGYMSTFSYWLLRTFPGFANIG